MWGCRVDGVLELWYMDVFFRMPDYWVFQFEAFECNFQTFVLLMAALFPKFSEIY